MVQGQPNKLAEMETLVAVAEHGGLSAAARETGKSPSAVSKLIARLEARLGARLFVRSTRQLQLTDEGAVFLERCKSILDRVDEANDRLGHVLMFHSGLTRALPGRGKLAGHALGGGLLQPLQNKRILV